MKKLILLLIFFTLIGCTEAGDEENYCYKGSMRILNMESYSTGRAGTNYRMYIYDGKQAKWYYTDANSYSKYQINDTLPTLVLKTTKYIKAD